MASVTGSSFRLPAGHVTNALMSMIDKVRSVCSENQACAETYVALAPWLCCGEGLNKYSMEHGPLPSTSPPVLLSLHTAALGAECCCARQAREELFPLQRHPCARRWCASRSLCCASPCSPSTSSATSCLLGSNTTSRCGLPGHDHQAFE